MVHELTTEVLHDGSRIDVIPDFDCHRWLGKAICFSKGSIHVHAIESRISAATRAFYAKQHILCAKSIPIGIRV